VSSRSLALAAAILPLTTTAAEGELGIDGLGERLYDLVNDKGRACARREASGQIICLRRHHPGTCSHHRGAGGVAIAALVRPAPARPIMLVSGQ